MALDCYTVEKNRRGLSFARSRYNFVVVVVDGDDYVVVNVIFMLRLYLLMSD